MKTLINKLTSTVSDVVLFTAGLVMAGLGLAFVGTLAMFALIAVGIALLVSPFLRLSQPTAAPVTEDAGEPAVA